MSAIFYHDDGQERLARSSMAEQQKKVTERIQTQVLPAETFYDAENYHQKFLLQRNHKKTLQKLNIGDSEVVTSHMAARLNGYFNGHGCTSDLKNEMETWELSKAQNEEILNVAEKYVPNGATCGL